MFTALVNSYLSLAGLKDLGPTELIQDCCIVLEMICKGLTIVTATDHPRTIVWCYVKSNTVDLAA